MKHQPNVRAAARARRLEREARNCLAIAIGKSGGFSADLIDEAVRLHARARELGLERPANDAAPHSASGDRSDVA